jgi:hypothetical protein
MRCKLFRMPQREHTRWLWKSNEEVILGLDDQPPITGFKVSDTGVGFNDENFDSFNTSFSEYKVARGGKGLGRFIWLKAFECVEIDSVFTEPDSDVLLQRTFIFNSDYDPDNAPAVSSDRLQTGTVVRLVGVSRALQKPVFEDRPSDRAAPDRAFSPEIPAGGLPAGRDPRPG